MKKTLAILLVISSPVVGQWYDNDSYDIDDRRYEQSRPYTIHSTLPGTNIRDYGAPSYRVEGDTITPLIPGTNIRDWGEPGYEIERDW